MSNKNITFNENPYDIETVFEAISIAADYEYEMLYMDKLIGMIRKNPEIDLTEANFKILSDLDLMARETSTT
jgi:hypothetical protein